MTILRALVFGAVVVVAASFASAAPAKADSFGFSVGPGGFGISVYDGYYGSRYHRRRLCWDPYYDDYVPCYRGGYYPSTYNGYYYGGPRWGYRNHWRGHRAHWRGGHHWRGDRGWRGRGHHGGRGGHRGRH